MEQQFAILREQLYLERISQIEFQLNEVRNGRSVEYMEPLKILTENMQNRVEVAGVLRKYRLENINHKFLAEEQGATQHFEVSKILLAIKLGLLLLNSNFSTFLQSEKVLAKDTIHEELLDKIRRLEEDRQNVDISWADWGTNTRASKVRGPGRKKAVTVSGPYIVYMLADEEIIDDWKMIRKALKKSPLAT